MCVVFSFNWKICFVFQINPKIKAAKKGVCEGDFITSVNGESTKYLTNSEVHFLINNSGSELVLGLNE